MTNEARLHHLTYFSSATELFSAEQLTELLRKSRVANEQRGITGMLLYKGGNFVQTIEGPEEAVINLHDRLGQDPRHHGISVVMSGARDTRLFAAWSMGFRDLDDGHAADVPGYSEFLGTPLTAQAFGENPAACQRLLLSFKTHTR